MNNTYTIDELLQLWVNHSSELWNGGYDEEKTLKVADIRSALERYGVTDMFLDKVSGQNVHISYKYRGGIFKKDLVIAF